MREVNGSGRVGSSRWQEVEGREGVAHSRGPRRELEPSHATHSEATKACSLMVCRTSENLILVVRVCPW